MVLVGHANPGPISTTRAEEESDMAPIDKRPLALDDVPTRPPRLSRTTADTAMILAAAVRSAMEDFHCEHLSDAQMKVLNPIIRNAIATGLYALEHYSANPLARGYIDGAVRCIPDYWESPRLVHEFSRSGHLRMVRSLCRRSGRTGRNEVVEMAEGMLNVGLRDRRQPRGRKNKENPRSPAS